MRKKSIQILVSMAFILSHCNLPPLDRFPLDFSTYTLFNLIFGAPAPSIGGQVTGLLGSGLKLNLESKLDNSVENEELTPSSNGGFLFRMVPKEGSTYTITILQQPTNPNQVCEVAGAMGTMGKSPIRNVLVQCGESLDLAMPTFTPPPGEFPSAVGVTISTTEALAKIFYTTDGSNPACNPDGTGVGIEYTTTINVPQPSLAGVEIRAIVCLEDRSSFIQTGLYRVTNGPLGMVTSSLATNPPAANYNSSPQFTTLSPPASPPPGTTIHYTVDGSTPTCSSPSTPNPVEMLVSTTIRAIACAPDYTASPVASFPYIIQGTVDTPTFTVAGGSFNNDQMVGLSVITPGASIRYAITTDGSAPSATCASTLYTGPIPVSIMGTRIQAIGCLSGWTDSPPTAVQTYNFIVAAPTLSPAPPFAIQSTQIVSASSVTTGATFHYTTDGATPTCANSQSPPSITANNIEEDITVRVIACKANYDFSSVVSGVYTKTGTLNPPTFTPPAGSYSGTQNITINQGSGNPAGTQIRFRTDGSPATCSDPEFDGTPISVPTSQTITAISCRTSPLWNPSSSASAAYTITGTLAPPTFTPTTGTFNDVQNVTINSNAGSTIYYTISVGSDPANPSCGAGSTTQPIIVTQTDTRIRAIACLTDWTDSPIGNATFTLQASTPVPNIPGGGYGEGQTITFTSATPGATIRINIDTLPATTPTCADPAQSSVTIPSGSGLRFLSVIACKDDFTPSLPFTPTYTIGTPLAMPSVTIDDQKFVTVAATGATRCYTINGSDPLCSASNLGPPDPIGNFCATGSTPYTGVFQITTPTDLRVRACQTGNLQSPVNQQNVTVLGTVGAVNITPVGGLVNTNPSITMTATDSTAIYYRMDGTNPDCSGVGATNYIGAFTLSPTTPGAAEIRAIGCRPDYISSAVNTQTYSFQVATPTTASIAETKINDESVTITLPTTPAPNSIRYRLDGVTPVDCTDGTLYTGPIVLPTAASSATPLLRAIGCKSDYLASNVLSRDYVFRPDAPVISNDVTSAIIGAVDTTTPPITVRFSTTTTGGRVCLAVNPTTDPSPTCDGTTGNCGAGTIDLGLDSGTYFYNGSGTIRTSAAICKQHYQTNSSFALRRFLAPATPIFRMFPSVTTVQGNIFSAVGPIAADDVCNNDSGRPSPNVPYLALIGSNAPSRSMTVGNPFLPSAEYRRNDGTTSILTTDGSSLPPTTITNSVTGSLSLVWTGFNPGPGFTVSSSCNNWTVNDTTQGARGRTDFTSNEWIYAGTGNCNSSHSLYCIESRFRIWVTANTTNGAFGGLAGGDTRCNDYTDANHPKSGRYKAMLFLGARIPTGGDWVFKPNAAYYRIDRTTIIGRTDNLGRLQRLDFTLGIENAYQGSPGSFWTGGTNSNFGAASSDNCSGFTDTAGNGTFGSADTTVLYSYVTNGSVACSNNTFRLLCVEQ